MDILDLRTFEAAARLGGMNRAALELNTVQSNVTARIRALEHSLGTELFHRHSRGVTLTRSGQRLLPYAVKMAGLVREAKRAVVDDGTPSGTLLLGSLDSTAALRLSPVITAFGLAHPGVELTLRVRPKERLVEEVLDHVIDGAFICERIQHPDIICEPAFLEELVIARSAAVPDGEPLFRPGCRILVKSPGCYYRDRLERMLAAAGVKDYGALEFGTLDAIVGCAQAGLGVTLLPRSVLAPAAEAKQVTLHPLPPELATIETMFLRPRDAAEFGAMRAFRELLETSASEQRRELQDR